MAGVDVAGFEAAWLQRLRRGYLPAARAMGVTVKVTRGRARIYAGTVDAPSHRVLGTLGSGQTRKILDIYAGEVVSVQGNAAFAYRIARPAAPIPPLPRPCTDPTSCEVVESVTSYWRCNVPDCQGRPFVGQVVTWPAWAAYESNSRLGVHSRTVYTAESEVLHP